MSRRREPAWSGPLRWTALHTAAAAWTVAGLLFWMTSDWLWNEIWLLSIIVFAAYVLSGAMIAFVCLWMGPRNGWTRSRVTAGAMLLGGATMVGEAGPGLTRMSGRWTFEARFRQMEPRYRQLTLRAAEGRLPRDGSWGGVRFVVDSGPPLRVAFPQPGNVTDNWECVVHDPSGSLAAAVPRRQGGDRYPPPRLAGLFGGRLTGCEHLSGTYYRCWFT